MSKARSHRLVGSMTIGMRASGRRLSRSKFMAGSPVVIIGSNSYNPVFRVLTFEYALGQRPFLCRVRRTPTDADFPALSSSLASEGGSIVAEDSGAATLLK